MKLAYFDDLSNGKGFVSWMAEGSRAKEVAIAYILISNDQRVKPIGFPRNIRKTLPSVSAGETVEGIV